MPLTLREGVQYNTRNGRVATVRRDPNAFSYTSYPWAIYDEQGNRKDTCTNQGRVTDAGRRAWDIMSEHVPETPSDQPLQVKVNGQWEDIPRENLRIRPVVATVIGDRTLPLHVVKLVPGQTYFSPSLAAEGKYSTCSLASPLHQKLLSQNMVFENKADAVLVSEILINLFN